MQVNEVELRNSDLRMKSNSQVLMSHSDEREKRNFLKTRVWKNFYGFLKRSFDLACGMVGTVLLFPILAFVKLAYLRHGDTAPVLFKQERIGKGGKTIQVYKIRSMVHNAEQVLEELMEKDPVIREEYFANKKLKNDPRVTRVGKFIRKTSLDEFRTVFEFAQWNDVYDWTTSISSKGEGRYEAIL